MALRRNSSGHFARTRALDLAVFAIAAALGVMVLWLVGRPLHTPDLWFHLKTGEMYLREGLWPETDPMLFTGLPGGPVQHEWLFEIVVHMIDRTLGFQGLRVAKVLLVLATLVLLTRVLRRASGSWVAAAAGCAAFVALSAQRLIQFRPDLWTIPATVLLYSWFIGEGAARPRARVLVIALPLFCLWANAHSLSVIGVALLAAGTLGAGLAWGILARTLAASAQQCAAARQRFFWLASVFAVAALASLVHPRGYHQLLTFAESSGDTAVTEIADEWTPFNMFAPGVARPLAWAVADVVLLGFACSVWLQLRALRREPTDLQLARFDPCGFMVAAAACGPMLISIRYLWLGFLPLAYVLRASRDWDPRPLRALSLLGTAAVCIAFPSSYGFFPEIADAPHSVQGYLTTPLNRRVVADESVRFLKAIDARGRIFCPYLLGSYIGYRLSPRLRTFIDSRTEHYPRQVFDDWRAITAGAALQDGRDYVRALEDYGVDFLFATGLPGYPYDTPYTLHLLERVPGWVLVYRNAGQAVYLRANERNRGNAQRVAQFYAKLGIPYDPAQGLDVGKVINARLDWAVAQHIVPARLPELERRTREGAAPARAAAAFELADALYVAGAFRAAANYAKQALAGAAEPARALRLALHALRRADEVPAAEALLARVMREHPNDPRLIKEFPTSPNPEPLRTP